jgi:hypothetical protein
VPGQPGTTKPAWKTAADGTTTFRLIPPLVLWWVWVAFAVVNVADLAIQSPDLFSLKIIIGILLVTGILYAATWRPKIISDAAGLLIRNPFRDYQVPWGALTGVFLGDNVEIRAARPAPQDEKTVYSWALYSPRRSRAKADLRAGFGQRRYRDRHEARAQKRYQVTDPSKFGRMPSEGKDLARQHPSHVMAGELARRCEQARKVGVTPAVFTGQWAWAPIAAVVIPLIAFIVVLVVK